MVNDYHRWMRLMTLSNSFDITIAYRHMLQSGPKVFETIFRHLIANPRSPFIVHCTAGKDRTGVFIMLLLGLCGVDDEVIAREYELTNLGYWGKLLLQF
jgi:protein tyrosine phosphatase